MDTRNYALVMLVVLNLATQTGFDDGCHGDDGKIELASFIADCSGMVGWHHL